MTNYHHRRKLERIVEWDKNPKRCNTCDLALRYDERRKKFCNTSCSAKYTNITRMEAGWSLSEDARKRISEKIKDHGYRTPKVPRTILNCRLCNKEFSVYISNTKRMYCSRKCCDADAVSSGRYKHCGGVRSGSGRAKAGWYKGIYCGSTYELAWVIWMLDHKKPFTRNTEGFSYEYEGKQYKYYPDFIIGKKEYIEVKGYLSPKDPYKWNTFPHDLSVLRKADLTPMLEYVKATYGPEWISLYDGNPHNERKNSCLVCGEPAKYTYCSNKCSAMNRHKTIRSNLAKQSKTPVLAAYL